jgi:hypothetical protein
MTKVDKEAKIQKTIAEKSRVVIEWKNIIKIKDEEESSSSSSSMSMYNSIQTMKIQRCNSIDLLL